MRKNKMNNLNATDTKAQSAIEKHEDTYYSWYMAGFGLAAGLGFGHLAVKYTDITVRTAVKLVKSAGTAVKNKITECFEDDDDTNTSTK